MFSDPQKNVSQFSLSHGMIVADLGAGAGYYVEPIARLVGETGRVFAVDVQKDLLQKIKTAANAARLNNVEVIWGDLEKVGGTKLQDASVDRVLSANVLFQLADRETFAREVWRILKPAGKLLVIDWADSAGGGGPRPEMIVSTAAARRFFESAGFGFEREIKAGDRHYGLIFNKS